MKLSTVIICWNDKKVIGDCLKSIYGQRHRIDFEVLVPDNGSTDGSVEFIREHYPQARVLENKANLGFGKGNNVGIRAATGDYVLILNPDTIVHDGAFDAWIDFADRHPEAGAFGCRVLNPDGTFQQPATRFPTVWRYWMEALFLHRLGAWLPFLQGQDYAGWDGRSEREIDQQSGCCVLFRGDLLRRLDGFDERFFYHFEETDLCKRVWDAGYKILYTPVPVITHLGGTSVSRFPIRFHIERLRNRYRYFEKHYGTAALAGVKRVINAHFRMRRLAYGLRGWFVKDDKLAGRLAMYRAVMLWNRHVDPVRFVATGAEPRIDEQTGQLLPAASG